MKVPIEDIAESMGLEIIRWHRLSDDFSVFGEICFSAGTIQLCDLFKCSHYDVTVRRGSILIDAYTFWQRNIGCVNAAHLGLSVPDAIKTVLEQLHDRPDGKEGQ